MFYATKIKQVSGDKAIDERGRVLSFVGYLPVTAGDTVFTDGNVIFGNAKVKGYSVVEEETSAIPVLADESKLSDKEEEMRGYFRKNGHYKNFPIVKDDWILNDRKKFTHGKSELEGQRIIEVEFSGDGDLFIVTDGEYHECQTRTFNNHLFTEHRTDNSDLVNISFKFYPYSAHLAVNAYVGSEITLGTNNEIVNKPISIFKGDATFHELDLKTYADFAKLQGLENKAKIMAKSDDITGAVNFFKRPSPPESFVASAWARVLSFKINKKGDWDAIIAAGSYGYCFPYVLLNGSVLHPTFSAQFGGSKYFSEKLKRCKTDIERAIFEEGHFPFLNIEQYPEFEGTVRDENGDYTPEYRQYIEDAIEYYIPLIRFTHFDWYTVAFGASMLFHVHNDEIVTTIQTRNFIGNPVYIEESWDETQYLNCDLSGNKPPNYIFTDLSSTEDEPEWRFPINDNFLLIGNGTIFNKIYDISKENTFRAPNIPFYWRITHERTDSLLPQNHYYREIIFDDKAYDVAELEWPNGEYDVEYVWGSYICLPHPFYYFVSNHGAVDEVYNKFPDEIYNAPNLKPYRFTDAFIDSRGEPFRFNPDVIALSKRQYLFGMYNYQLYKGNFGWNLLADHLKNFRLRKMSNIKKAKG